MRFLLVISCLGAFGCATSNAPWDVRRGQETRFKESRRVCRLLTDDDAGLREERFETCMKRRGWERQGFITRLLRN